MKEMSRRSVVKLATLLPLAACGDGSSKSGGPLTEGLDAGATPDADPGSSDSGLLPDAKSPLDAGGRPMDAGEPSMDAGGLDAGERVDAQEVCTPTGSDVEGPFHRSGAPHRAALVGPEEPGEPMGIEGVVVDIDCRPLAGTNLDIWQADASGQYDSDSTDYRLRAQVVTDDDGHFSFTSIKPGHYPNGNGFRPAHVHFIVSRAGFRPLTTQLYFAGDPYLPPNDSCGVCNSWDETHIIELTPKAGTLQGWFQIVLERL